ncbi:MAG: hypothetical protein EXR28_05595 [Betaproteobacteria bacterium]|nr:hypothetical protein [Betaproteobacteria bacterium]
MAITDAARALANLGESYEFDRLSFKPYPTCRLTHPAIGAALEMRKLMGDDAKTIERVKLVIGPQAHDVVGRDSPERRSPRNPVNAQFSIYWCVAAALAYGEVTPRQLNEQIPPSPELVEGIARISCSADPGGASRDVGGCTLRAFGPFGMKEAVQTHAKGHPDHPLSDAELLDKFNANLSYAKVSATDAAQLAQAIFAIDELEDIRPLAEAIASAAPVSSSRSY